LIIKALSDEKCYILGLEGGGDHGAYQAGAFKALVDALPPEQRCWDVVSGVSAGSMNGFAISIFPKGQEEAARDYLINGWRKVKGYTDLYQSWPWGGIIKGLWWETGLYDTTPLKTYLANLINNKTLEREFVLGATNMETGMFENFDTEDLKEDEYITAVMASGAFPVFFPNIKFRNKTYMDGGVKVSVDIPTAVNKCRDQGFRDRDIVVDVLLNGAKNMTDANVSSFHPLNVLYRVYEIYGYDTSMRDLEEMSRIFPNVTIRYVVAPTKPLPSGDIPLSFKPDQIETMIQMGIVDGKNVVKKGPGVNFKKMLYQHYEEKAMRIFGKKTGHKC